MEAEASRVRVRSSYNVAGISFNPRELSHEIRKLMPEFEISYDPDFRQAIADSWPASIDDSVARADWGLTTGYDLPRLTSTMLSETARKLGK